MCEVPLQPPTFRVVAPTVLTAIGRRTGHLTTVGCRTVLCEDPRPHAWSMCAACFCSCISPMQIQPTRAVTYQTSQFLITSEFPTELPTHIQGPYEKPGCRGPTAFPSQYRRLNYPDFSSSPYEVRRETQIEERVVPNRAGWATGGRRAPTGVPCS